ncbi:unnamed protein product, partial [Ostreobium quekettii]
RTRSGVQAGEKARVWELRRDQCEGIHGTVEAMHPQKKMNVGPTSTLENDEVRGGGRLREPVSAVSPLRRGMAGRAGIKSRLFWIAAGREGTGCGPSAFSFPLAFRANPCKDIRNQVMADWEI